VLGKIGPAAAEAVPALIEALRDSDKDVSRGAADALGKIRATNT
jgi:HEAT repeat protein